MHHLTLKIKSNEQLAEIIGKNHDYFLILKHMPQPALCWEKADITINGMVFNNVDVRCLQFDLRTEIEGLTGIIKNSTQNISIYQFDKPIPDTLVIEYLPENAKEHILQQNGLKHIFNVDYEFLTISSFDEGFLERIRGHAVYSEQIVERT